MLHDFALVAEGPTDHAILRNILIGYFKNQREPDIHREHPDPQAEKQYGGWTLVLQYLRNKKYAQTFQLNRFLIVQVDTDVAEDTGFDVPRQNINGPLSLPDFVKAVVKRLSDEIGPADISLYGDRFIFAIGVEQLECWILPLWFNGAQAQQTAGCTNRLTRCNGLCNELDKRNYRWIRKEEKCALSYDSATREYRKRATLMSEGPKSPSLGIFLNELSRRNIQLPPVE